MTPESTSIPFHEWLKAQRLNRNYSLASVAESVPNRGRGGKPMSKTWLVNLEKGKEQGGSGVPDKRTCLDLGRALDLEDPEQVWRRGRRERLAQLDEDLLAWHDEEVERAQDRPRRDPDEVDQLLDAVLLVPKEHRPFFCELVAELIRAAGVSAEVFDLEVEEIAGRTNWSRLMDLGRHLQELTEGLPHHLKFDLLLALMKGQLEARRFYLRAHHAHAAPDPELKQLLAQYAERELSKEKA